MSETTSSNQSSPDTNAAQQVHPSNILMNLIVGVLAPMFLTASNGDIGFARMAAIETINAYCARSHADLIAIAQIIACGLTALGSLSLSLDDNISLSMTLRLRANAVALNRVAEQNRRVLTTTRPETPVTHHPDGNSTETAFADESQAALDEAEIVASVAAAKKLSSDALARFSNPSPTAAITATTPAAPLEQWWQSMLASALTDAAGKRATDLGNLPPAQRRGASHRTAMLSSSASQLLAGDVAPPAWPDDRGARR